MITIKEYIAPETIEEAYEILMASRANMVLGGLGFIKMASKSINKAIDLGRLSLDYIKETEDEILIGAETSLRELEINDIIKNYCGGAISQGVSNIVGVQFRNMAKVGASVFSKYGFSDLIPSLLVLDAKVRLHKGGLLRLEEFLEKDYEKDILVEVILPKIEGIAVYDSIRKSTGDFPVINGALFKGQDGQFKIALGSRPQRAKLAIQAAKALENGESIEKVADMIPEEIYFGGNSRASKEYRQDMSKAIVRRMYSKVGDYNDR